MKFYNTEVVNHRIESVVDSVEVKLGLLVLLGESFAHAPARSSIRLSERLTPSETRVVRSFIFWSNSSFRSYL